MNRILDILNEGFDKAYGSSKKKKVVKESVRNRRSLKEEVSDETYEIADIMANVFNSMGKSVTMDDFDEQFALACRKVLGVDNVWENQNDELYELEQDVRGILEYKGWSTEFEGDNEGGLSIVEAKSLKESPVYDLSPRYDARKSFYSKAKVDTDEKESSKLYSYNTLVAEISNGEVTLYPKWDSSQTTLRHVKEFLKQSGFKAISKEQIRRDYEK